MADILIRMEMPKDCYTCSFRTTVGLDEWMCMVNKMRFPSWESGWNGDTYRHENCPLQELPEHGDLISKDDAMNAILGEPPEAHYPSWYASIVNEIPAIVPSNKEESE